MNLNQLYYQRYNSEGDPIWEQARGSNPAAWNNAPLYQAYQGENGVDLRAYSGSLGPTGRLSYQSPFTDSDGRAVQGVYDEAGREFSTEDLNAQYQNDFNRLVAEAQSKGLSDAQLVGYVDQQMRAQGLGSQTGQGLSFKDIDRLIEQGIVNGNAVLPSGENLYGFADRNRAAANDRGMFGVSDMFDQFAIGAAGMLAGGALGGAFGGAGAGTTAATEAALASATPFAGGGAALTAGTGAGAGAAGAAAGASGLGLSEMSSGGYQAPSVETGAWNGGAPTNTTPPPQTPGPINSTFEPSRFGSFDPRTGASISNIGNVSGGAGASGGIGMARDALGLGMGLYGLYNADQMQDQMSDMLRNAQELQGPRYPNEMNWDLVDQYLRDPMQILRNNPGYLASVDFVEKEARRKMAQGGYNASGNSTHYLADVLGKNASKWYEQSWAPIRDAAGLMQNPDPARLAGVQANALGQINTAKQNAIGSMAKATGDALPNIFKFALS